MPGIPVTLKAELVRFWIGGQPGQLNKIHYPLVKKKKKIWEHSPVSAFTQHTQDPSGCRFSTSRRNSTTTFKQMGEPVV